MPKTLLLVLFAWLIQACGAEPYDWHKLSPAAIIAPSDQVSSRIRGASLQGGLVDLRYGQAALEVGGEGLLLEYGERSVFTLDGSPTSAEQLAQKVEEGMALLVAVRYNPESGLIGWCDAVSTVPVPAVELRLDPLKTPALLPGDTLRLLIGRSEIDRLGLKSAQLLAPGMTHSTPFRLEGRQLLAELPIMQGWNWHELPLFVRASDGRVFRGRRISVSSSGPLIKSAGPQVASASLSSIPGWIDLAGNTRYLDPSATRITASTGARISEVTPRAGRISFRIEVDGPGTYWLEAVVKDSLGREARKKWPFSVRL